MTQQMQNFCNGIRLCREHHGLTAKRLARISGVPENRIIAFEAYEAIPNLNQLEKLAAAMQTDVVAMLSFGTTERPVPNDNDTGLSEQDPRYKHVLTCRFSRMGRFGSTFDDTEWACMRDSNRVVNTNPTACASCPLFKSRYIQYPVTISSIDLKPIEVNFERNIGQFVAVKPCGEEYNGKTYLGLHLGDHAMMNSTSLNEKSGTLTVRPVTNPLIYIFATKTLVFGAESWWHRIESPDELKDIIEDDINSTWYVQLMRAMSKKEDKQ